MEAESEWQRWSQWCCVRPQTPQEIMELKDHEAGDLIRAGQAELYFLLALQLVIVVLWTLTQHVPGICPLEGATSFNAVCHTGFWLAIEVFILAFGAISVGFSVWAGINGKLVKDLRRTRNWLIAYLVFLVLGIIANGIHFGAAINEMRHCTTTLCNDGETRGYLTAVAVGVALLLVIQVLLFYRAFTFLRHLERINAAFSNAFTLDTTTASQDYVVELSTPSAPPGDQNGGVLAKIRQHKLVQKSQVGHGLKMRSE